MRFNRQIENFFLTGAQFLTAVVSSNVQNARLKTSLLNLEQFADFCLSCVGTKYLGES